MLYNAVIKTLSDIIQGWHARDVLCYIKENILLLKKVINQLSAYRCNYLIETEITN